MLYAPLSHFSTKSAFGSVGSRIKYSCCKWEVFGKLTISRQNFNFLFNFRLDCVLLSPRFVHVFLSSLSFSFLFIENHLDLCRKWTPFVPMHRLTDMIRLHLFESKITYVYVINRPNIQIIRINQESSKIKI